MAGKWTTEEIKAKIEELKPWYHKIDLGDGIITPGSDFDRIWDMIRSVRGHLDYKGKNVLELGSMDGMWAFEAEKLGAKMVIAADCTWKILPLRNFLFCREILGSDVTPYYNVSVYDLFRGLATVRHGGTGDPGNTLFDIVQCNGILYHLRNPMLIFSQIRSIMPTGGHLMIETTTIADEEMPFLLFNGIPYKSEKNGLKDSYRIYNSHTTWWAPTIPCLKEMLRASLFEPLDDTLESFDSNKTTEKLSSKKIEYQIARSCLIARAMDPAEAEPRHLQELCRADRDHSLVTKYY